MSAPARPIAGPLAALEGEIEVLAEPGTPRRPWVIARGERVFKAYDLSHFDATDRARLLAEAKTALALSDLDGVVTTYGFEVEEGWLVIEMERLGENLGDYLQAVAAGTRPPLETARWGALFETVARTLDEIHRRRQLHRDVKPANLIFDRDGERLLVADFSVAIRRPRGAREKKAGLAGTRRYIAPEVMRGRVGPAADQYGLGVTAGDALGKAVPPAAKPVLLRATEQNPEDRYGSIADFGLALRSALDETAPRRVSSRLQRVSVGWRQTWAVEAAAFAGAYGLLLWRRPPALGWEDGLVLPLLAAAFAMLAARMLFPLRGGRSQPRLAIADRGWFPVLLFGIAIAAFAPLLVDNPAKNAPKLVLFAAGDWTRDDLRRGAPAFGTDQLAELRLSDTAPISDEPTWRIRERDGEGLDVGSLSRESADGRVWEVTVIRRPPSDDPLGGMDKTWRYEVVRDAGRWWISAIEICDFNSARPCIRVTQRDRSQLPKIVRQGPPGGP